MGAYASAVLADTPLAYYKLDEASGNFADSSGNGFTGTVSGTIHYNESGPRVETGKAIRITDADGGGYIDATLTGINTTAGTDVTVEWWQQHDGATATGDIVCFRTAETGNYAIWIDNTVTPAIYGYNTFNNDIYGVEWNQYFKTSYWHHVVGIFRNNDRNSSRLFIDGIERTLAQQRNVEGASNDVTTLFRIGAGAGPAHTWDGRVAHVAVYNGGLSPTRVEAHFTLGSQQTSYYARRQMVGRR